MSPMLAVLAGARLVCYAWRVWALTWAVTAAFAAIVVVPVAAVLRADLGHSLYAARMLGNFDVAWLAELQLETAGMPAVVLEPLLAAVCLAFLLVMTFLNGGALAVLAGTTTFWSGCGRNFARLARLLVYAVAGYALVLGVHSALGRIIGKLWHHSMEERPVALAGWGRAAIVVLLALLVNMIFDYAKIHAVAGDTRAAWRNVLGALQFVRRNFAPAAAAYAVISLAALVLAGLWWLISGVLPRTAVGWLVLVLMLQQAFVAARVWVRLWYLASQTEFFRARFPDPTHCGTVGA
ncbi:MAG TPA: hypothetical protein VF767_08460 [Bryobacteraceae bacterium]